MPTEEAPAQTYPPDGERTPAASEPDTPPDTPAEVVADAAPETTGEEAAEETPESPPVDVLGDDAPDALTAFDDRDKPFSIKPEDLKDLDPRALHVLANMRRDYTQKTQAAAARQRDLDAREKHLTGVQEQLQRSATEVSEGRQKLLAMFGDERLRAFATPPAVPADGPPDRWSEEGQKYYTEVAIAEHFQSFLQAFSNVGAEEEKQLEQTRAEWQLDRRRSEIQTFLDKTPDFEDHRAAVIALRKESNNHLPVERAYQLVKSTLVAAGKSEAKAARKEARQISSKPSLAGQRTAALLPPSNLSGSERALWFEKHPESAAELYKRMSQYGD